MAKVNENFTPVRVAKNEGIFYGVGIQQYLTLDERDHSNCLNYKSDDMFRACDEDFVMGKLTERGWKKWCLFGQWATKLH